MRENIAALLVPAVALLALAGCAPAPGAQSPRPANYAPYDPETNPFCGALGDCQPLIDKPYPLHGNSYN
ncbi:MAG TPA: hypothetical protein VLV50_11700 [Stellaceae bacterium]|nr:hypothetical protein [Stellaceae bacterium]